jgi:predicted nuclease with TOPRIM domain
VNLNNDLLNVVIPAVVGIVSSVTTFFVARSNNSKDLTISDRQQLSEDEKAFRQELRDTINTYKQELEEARREIKELRQEVAELHQVNLNLTLENKKLQAKVEELKNELQNLQGKG